MTAPSRAGLRDVMVTGGAFALGLLLLALFLLVAGFDVPLALGALWRGAFGSWYAITSATLVRATPLILLGLAFTLGSRGGALNIGMEGQFALGAMAAAWAGTHVGGLPMVVALPIVLAAGMIGGIAWMAVPVLLKLRFGVTEVISTLLLNFVAEAAVSWAVSGPMQEPTHVYPQSAAIAASAQLPKLLPGARLHLGLVLAVLVAVGLMVLLRKTRWGFELRAVGAGPRAAEVSGGIRSGRLLAVALL
ncbi:MAG: ABC transporter permease, partial [Gemmatimonadetes bacterium]|nr:ABC transporter permease [Gemmatimonadota bacterium]